jgi:CubicO group peptidase (beta-lactamase class C family)
MDIVSPETVGLSSSRLARLDAGMQRYIDRGQVAGIQTVVVRRGKVAHQGCYGWLDLATGAPMRADALFRIYSMTKSITCLAVMMLHEEGLLHLTDPIAAYFPALGRLQVAKDHLNLDAGLEPLARPITIYDLLLHISGIGYGLVRSDPVESLFVSERMLRMDESMAEKIDRMAAIPLHHQPGLRFTYSMGTDILGHLVEIISGQTLDDFLRSRIFEPLGMPDTAFSVPPEKRDRLAHFYTPLDGKLVDLLYIDEAMLPQFLTGAWVRKEETPRFLSGGGGLVSSTADYLRYVMMLRGKGSLDGERLVSRKTFELMAAPHLSQQQLPTPGCSLGFGLTVVTNPAQALILGSPGAFTGGGAAGTEFWVDPVEDLAGLLMIQYVAETPLALAADFRTLAAQAIDD